jgi:hypothetical protein
LGGACSKPEGEENEFKILIRKSEGKRMPEIRRNRWKDVIKLGHKEIMG